MLYDLREKTLNSLVFYFKRLKFKPRNSHINLYFSCGFHGKSGGPIAIASTANGLANIFSVNFKIHPGSFYCRLLSHTVRFTQELKLDNDLYFFDLSANIDELKKVKAAGKPTILTIHGLRTALHQLNTDHIDNMLAIADWVHFVGQVQQSSYQLPNEKFFIIPNSAQTVNKSQLTNNIGVVGNLDEPRKNAALSVEAGLSSNCDQIHLWSTSRQFSGDPRVIHHQWENNKEKIFNSFDVLVFLSQQETFGLVVAEALSAGIPCVLSSIEAFMPFKACPGVILIEDNQINDVTAAINRFLIEKESLKPLIQAFFNSHFSREIIEARWADKVAELTSLKK
ncbi:glycosyltransferase family 4 protein [Paraglaciecola sp.]|uniref:glycosyltransferase family 4 protein n=1 Tax=Paraglaciecola sp. TaxID=1920173 RepID=UPI00273D2A7F|nr:glycosyltransferase family 4 protein [Paraglaciecola sp.]MDP5032085.1 glycosyltransferase [Paraglaciecola sp.]